MGFRDLLLQRIAEGSTKRVRAEIDPDKLQAFTTKDIEKSLQLYFHLKNLGYTFDDLAAFAEKQRDAMTRNRTRMLVNQTINQTREERKRLAGSTREGQRRREQNG